MPFEIPTFPLLCSIYGPLAEALPARLEDVPCNLAWGERVGGIAEAVSDTLVSIRFTMQLLLPAGTDIRPPLSGWAGDFVEVPQASGRFYRVVFVDDRGKGFFNEHRCAVLRQRGDFPFPIP